jgi:hypothetical protein
MRLAMLGLGLLVAACPGSTCPDVIVEPIQITNVDVTIMESFPPQALAHVEGVLGDACAELNSVTQSRLGRRVTMVILRERPRDAICAQIAKLYREDVPLEGVYPAGQYLLRVNDYETTFATD